MKTKRKDYRNIYILLIMLITVFSVCSCSKQNIKIGFVGSLTGKNSQLSIDARNAILLGVKYINDSGGINGRKLELVVKDDEASLEVAIEKHSEFDREGIQLIIGHITSNMADAVLESQNENLLFISPSMGTSKLSNRDDFFIRTSPLTNNQAYTFFDLMEDLSVNNVAVLYDLMNAEYTETLAKYIDELNENSGDHKISLISFDSRTDELSNVANEILKNKDLELVIMISQAIDTAVISQYIKRERGDINLASVSWSMTEDLIINGGRFVENMYFVGVYKSETQTEEKIKFYTDFLNEYSYEPSFICYLAYDSFKVLADALKSTENYSAISIKSQILGMKVINGIEEEYTIDEFGDNNRGYTIYQLKKKEFVPIYR